jgi:predicted NACHT family NTPase
VFDRLGGGLLILGAPGSGKTTALLELARHLLDKAEADEHQPIPVVFNLVSWAAHRGPVAD